MKRSYVLMGLVALFVVYAGWAFADSITPYVDIAEARTARGSVQVKGLLAEDMPAPQQDGKDFVFWLVDETGEKLEVRYHGTEPDQFRAAHHIVAVGSCKNGVFEAERLLIKCPSKYEKMKGGAA